MFLQTGLTKLVCEPTFTTSNNMQHLILLSNTEIVGEVAILPSLPKCQHFPGAEELCIEVNDDLISSNVCLWHKGNYAAINEEFEQLN